MTSEGLGEMFEGDSADTCGGKYSIMSMGGLAEGLACADPGARTPIGVSGNSGISSYMCLVLCNLRCVICYGGYSHSSHDIWLNNSEKFCLVCTVING